MESIQVNENRDTLNDLPEQLFPPECNDSGKPDACDEFLGVPEIVPRVSAEFQAEIPPLEEDLKYILRLEDSKDAETSQHNFLIGLPIPLTWASLQYKNFVGLPGKCGIRIDQSNDSRRSMGSEGSRFLVPGLSTEPWGDEDKSSFLLGLYIFEKNFVEVRRFVGTKGMGAILSFYYGNFYGSAEYRRWSDCIKSKSKKCVHGQRIFSGWRQQELVYRMLPKLSEECRTALLEVSKTFGDEKVSFTEYVFSLKAVVGMRILVDAVGIGTGKRDLTRTALDTSKSSHAIRLRPEIPNGKACSTLTTSEIIRFLTGGYRLSKARSNDLFWEAVWPRLLARGWQSEQPNDHGYVAGFKGNLVFLVPGVKKFRRKLVKGDQYFDSVTDVLNKVAKEPGLIELDSEQEAGEEKEKCILKAEVKVEEGEDEDEDEDQPVKKRCNYLQPRTPSRSRDTLKFMVVDTSLSNGEVRELRGMPSQISSKKVLSRVYKEDAEEEDASVETMDESEAINGILQNASLMVDDSGKTTKPGDQIPLGGLVPESHSSRDDISKKQSRKVSKSFLGRKSLAGPKLEQAAGDHVAPVSKKSRKLAACSREEASDAVSHSWAGPKLENPMSSCSSGVNHGFTGNLSSGAGSCQDTLSTSSSRGSPCESVECASLRNTNPSEPPQLLIDLNVPPQIPPDFDNGMLDTDLSKEHMEERSRPDDRCLPEISSGEARSEPATEQRMSEKPPDVNPRRQGTRNRPPTARALEALANGYLTANRRKRSKEGTKKEDLAASRPLLRPRLESGPAQSSNSFMSSQIEEAENFGKRDELNKFQDLPEANEESVSRL